MNKLALTAAATLLASGVASANNMFIDVGDSSYDNNLITGTGVVIPGASSSIMDPDTTTGVFNEFGFSQILATSIYDYSDSSIGGSFFDTNIPDELTAASVPSSGTALDGVTQVSLVTPDCANGQCDIDALSPLVPPLGTDAEGFLNTWDLQVEYHFDGTLTAGGPVYTGGYLNIFFNDLLDDTNDRLVITASLTGSTINAANLDLFFDITFAEEGFLFIDNGNGSFIDAYAGTVTGDYATMQLDTNVNPPIPNPNQLLVTGTCDPLVQYSCSAIRQTTLDGSITANIPEPASLALVGLGLLGLGAARRRK